ncbi:MAG: hypothetical protein AMXMBFR44_6820 [Candidatus Campbellbacteria bacterium]
MARKAGLYLTSTHISPLPSLGGVNSYRLWLPTPSENDAAATWLAIYGTLARNPNSGSGIVVYKNYVCLFPALREKVQHRLALEARCGTSPLHGGSRVGGGVRGVVKNFSEGSRGRLIKKMLAWHEVPDTMVTLTYPDEPEVSPKRDLDALKKRMARAYPDVQGLWRIEWIARKSGGLKGVVMPHFHLILKTFDTPTQYEEFKAWIARAWNEVARKSSWERRNTELHARRGCHVQRLRSARGAMSYASKYLAKVDARASLEAGRHWGVVGKLNCTPLLVLEMQIPLRNGLARKLLKRVLARSPKSRGLRKALVLERYRRQRVTVWSYGTGFGDKVAEILLAPRPPSGKSVTALIAELVK